MRPITTDGAPIEAVSSSHPGPTTLSPTFPGNGSGVGPSSADSSTSTSGLRKSPVQHQWPTSGTPHREYALASHVRHPGNVYLREADLLPAIDSWLLVIFAPHRLEQTIREMQTAQDPSLRTAAHDSPGEDTQALIADCDARLARYQAALDAGADPQAVAEWTRQVKTERAAALARDASQNCHTTVRQLTEDDIRAILTGLGDLRDIIREAEPPVKAAIYKQLGLKVTYLPGQDKLRADVTISPRYSQVNRINMGQWVVSEGRLHQKANVCSRLNLRLTMASDDVSGSRSQVVRRGNRGRCGGRVV